jgi:uncharacterized membrane protein YphA (DoxX/SURF4 family)/thiol-disulfide isomerase/thioredoxin
MKTILQNRWLLFSLRLILGVIFIVASISKLQDIAKFVSTVVSYGMLPDVLGRLYGYLAPWVELLVGCALILGVFVRLSAAVLIPLIISFMIASSYALANAVGGTCGCFGKFLTLSYPAALSIDVLMLIAALILLFQRDMEFLSVGRTAERFHVKSKISGIGLRLAIVVIIMAIVAVTSIAIGNASKKAYTIIETVNITTLLANDVDNALSNNKPVLLEFYAPDCIACQEAEPVIVDLEKLFIRQTVFIRVDYYQNPQAVSDMNIITTPTILVIVGKNNEGKYNVLCRFEGTVQKTALQAFLQKAIDGK